ncbi:hypothetical protein AB1046_23730 [Promicromonospora sp. Populi]|uniref:hypothetical protein n=1 Tax=Promicromonospora sp. Populi TaxID=3239420 RepID=UPI0034E260B0
MAGISTNSIPKTVDGPSLVAAASGLMLLPENASRLVRLHRLAALGMALPENGARPVSPSAVRSILKQEDIGGRSVLVQEDPYSEVLVQSVSFFGGPYLISAGSGEHTIADLENFINAIFHKPGVSDSLRDQARHLIQGLLTISDMVLKRAGLARGTSPEGTPQTPIDVPGAQRLKKLTEATFISNEELDSQSDWLRVVVDTFACEPGQLVDPCDGDITDDRLYTMPFLRLANGYRVVLPLDLAITMRFHLLRFALEEGQLEKLGERWREAAFRRFLRSLPRGFSAKLLEQTDSISRYLLNVDDKRDIHVIVATDPLVDWQLEVWGSYNTGAALNRLASLVNPDARSTYSSAEELLHLVITDSPGRDSFWGIPNVDGADPVLIARADDLEVILHHEPDRLIGLMLFAQAIESRSGESYSTNILDEFCIYIENERSFYISDERLPTLMVFQAGDGLYPRKKFHAEVDRHGVAAPQVRQQILQVQRLYARDAPEIFIVEPGASYIGFVVELGDQAIFVTFDVTEPELANVELMLLECVAYWVRECAVCTGGRATRAPSEIRLAVSDSDSWKRVGNWSTADPAVRVTAAAHGHTIEFTESFVALLQDATNTAERELVSVLLNSLFGIPEGDLDSMVDMVAPLGPKRMLNVYSQNGSPDMVAEHLPRPLTGHSQITARLLDELGEWLRSPTGGRFSTGPLADEHRVDALNAAVEHLFERLETEVASYEGRSLLEFVVLQNEALIHDAKINATTLRSRLACFGEQSHTVAELVEHRKDSATAQRASRFLIEYVAAQPPTGTRAIETLDYYRLLGIASELIERATISDFLHYKLADFEVSILGSGRLGVGREEPVILAMDAYAANSGTRSVRNALSGEVRDAHENFDVLNFIAHSDGAMRAEFGFTLTELREVCGGLLDLASGDRVTRIRRSEAVAEVGAMRGVSISVVTAVFDGITLTQRPSFLSIKSDAFPWRFNRDSSYVRRPLVLQGNDLVFGFRSIYSLGPYWVDNLLSGRLQGRAKTTEMQRCISEARRKINDDFARAVATRLDQLGMTTRLSVNKVRKRRISDSAGNDIGDIDILAVHAETRTIIAVEAKDFEIARTPAELANELEKMFSGKKGKKSAVELHNRRIDWLREHISDVVLDLGLDGDVSGWQVIGVVVTSDPLITPLVATVTLPVIPLDDLSLDSFNLAPERGKGPSTSKNRRRR